MPSKLKEAIKAAKEKAEQRLKEDQKYVSLSTELIIKNFPEVSLLATLESKKGLGPSV